MDLKKLSPSNYHKKKDKNKGQERAKVYNFKNYKIGKQNKGLNRNLDYKVDGINYSNQAKNLLGQIGKGVLTLIKEGLKGAGDAYFQKKMDDIFNSPRKSKENEHSNQMESNRTILDERKRPIQHYVRGYSRKTKWKGNTC